VKWQVRIFSPLRAPCVSLPLCALLLLLLLLSGCARWPELNGDEVVATRTLEPGEREALATDAWRVRPGVYRIRFSALYSYYSGFELPLAGVVEVDTLKTHMRMVGLTDTGLTLFDIESAGGGGVGEVGAGEVEVNFLVEGLLKLPDFAGTVGRAAQRIFLAPFPGPEDSLEQLPERYLLRAKGAGVEVEFTLAGDGRLVAKKPAPAIPERVWRVRYSGHGDAATAPFPARMKYSDDETGATLRLRLNSVRFMQ
jgi:hypothetical protein